MNKQLFSTILLTIAQVSSLSLPAVAQITPDNTLGSEASLVRQGTIKGMPSDIIDKGARRGKNLFHSFTEFNINEGRGAYFINPQGVENILSRVTGVNASKLFGTLGVLGNANLYFLNPNGIIFGANAQLDLNGSFVGTTADSVKFDNNYEFSASNPDKPLLTVNLSNPIGVTLGENSQDISSSANLGSPKDLTLSANNLSVAGSITTGGNLNLEAQNLVTVAESQGNPSLITTAGDLLIQGNQGVNLALFNPQSVIGSAKNLTLRSGVPINGAAYFWSGANFQVQNLDDSLGSMQGLSASVIHSLGDVSMLNYQGGSLQIIAGGAITIPDFVWITGANPNYGSMDSVTLSSGQNISLNGKTENLVDLRAGVSPEIIKNLGREKNLPLSSWSFHPNPTSADITLGTTIFRNGDFSQTLGGKVLLTNQYQPNPNLAGNIAVTDNYPNLFLGAIETGSTTSGGTIAVDSKGSLNIVGGARAYATGEAGNIILTSAGEMNLLGRFINSLEPTEQTIPGKIDINSQGNFYLGGDLWNFGGEIAIKGGGEITLEGGVRSGYALLTPDNEVFVLPIPSGNITIDSKGNINVSGNVESPSSKKGGDITLKSEGDIILQRGYINSTAAPGGKIEITAENLTLNALDETDVVGTRSSINAGMRDNFGAANQKAGDINIKVNNQIQLNQLALISNWLGTETEGDGGNINLEAKSIQLNSGAQISTINQGTGKIGDIFLKADKVTIDGALKGLTSRVYSNAYETPKGDSGNITVETKNLEILNGGDIGVENFVTGEGNGGNITIRASESVLIDGEGVGDLNGTPIVFGSQIASNLGFDAIGKAGNIDITTDSLKITRGARLSGSVYGTGEGGKITINAKSVLVDGEKSDGFSTLIDSSLQTGVGKGGDIEINSDSLTISQGAQVNASSFAQGDGGNITINVGSFVLEGETKQGNPSILATGVSDGAVGNAGIIRINADTIKLLQGGQMQSLIDGEGKAGEIILEAKQIYMSGATSQESGAGISSQIGPTAKGNAGTIKIKADSMLIEKGAGIDSATFGKGNAGSVLLDVGSLKLDSADIASTVEKGARGNGGEIVINSQTVEGTNISLLSVGVSNQAIGKGGNITINADSLKLFKGFQIQAATFSGGNGDGGNITINAPEIIIDGEDDTHNAVSLITTVVDENAIGNAGNIQITTDQLSLTRGGQIQAGMLGKGKAGKVVIDAQKIDVDGEASDGIPSAILSTLGENAQGVGGEITISTRQLNLTNAGWISASTKGDGDGGSININAQEVLVDGRSLNQKDSSGISTGVGEKGKGSAGDITLRANSLLVQNGGTIDSNTKGKGNAGILTIATDNTQLLGKESAISSRVFEAATGNGGRININTGELSIEAQSQITASTAGKGNGGSVLVTATQSVNLDGGKISTAVEKTGVAEEGSKIEIDSPTLTLREKAEITASTSGKGDAGEILVNTKKLSLDTGAILSAFTQGDGNGGNIEIYSPNSVNIGSHSNLTVETSSSGKAGNITITSDTITLGENSQLSATATNTSTNTSGGGSINLNTSHLNISGKLGIFAETQGESPAGDLSIKPFSPLPQPLSQGEKGDSLNISFSDNGFISARTTASGKGGNIDISAPDTINISGQGKITAETSGTGNAGNINLTSQTLNLADGVEISASTSASGNAGNIQINTPNSLTIGDNSRLTVETTGAGNAGNIDITTPTLTIGENAELSARTRKQALGQAGNITLNTSQINISGKLGIFAETEGEANAGNLSITALTQSPLAPLDKGGTGLEAPLTKGGRGDQSFSKGGWGDSLNIAFSKEGNISASTKGSGNGGDITITAPETINLSGNGNIKVETSGSGDAGDIQITTKNLNLADGVRVSASTSGTGKAGNINLTIANNLNLNHSSILSSTLRKSTGDGGNITIDPIQVNLSNNSKIAVDSQGQGDGGNIYLSANDLTLEGNSTISAVTNNGQGGNITLTVPNYTILKNSPISATAGSEGGGGNGGNITLKTKWLIADDSPITANAYSGKGGNIDITAQGIFLTPDSTIDASSQLGIDGTVKIQTPDTNPTEGLIEHQQINPPLQIVTGCRIEEGMATGSFSNTGKGGLATLATDDFQGNNVWEDIRPLSSSATGDAKVTLPSTKPAAQPVVEAVGWRWKDEKHDTVIFISNPEQVNPQSSTSGSIYCKN